MKLQFLLLLAQTLVSQEILPPVVNEPIEAPVKTPFPVVTPEPQPIETPAPIVVEPVESAVPSIIPVETPTPVVAVETPTSSAAPSPTATLLPGTIKDCAIIRQLYDATGGPNWIDQGLDYINGDCCKWTGKIDCNPDGKVVNM